MISERIANGSASRDITKSTAPLSMAERGIPKHCDECVKVVGPDGTLLLR